jgi:hypothetical protein
MRADVHRFSFKIAIYTKYISESIIPSIGTNFPVPLEKRITTQTSLIHPHA